VRPSSDIAVTAIAVASNRAVLSDSLVSSNAACATPHPNWLVKVLDNVAWPVEGWSRPRASAPEGHCS
jgi:hypothetical protein